MSGACGHIGRDAGGSAAEGTRIYAASCLFLDDGTVLRPGAIAVSRGTVVAAGSPAEVARAAPAGAARVDLPGQALLPGLVNAHTHLQIPRLAAGDGETAGGPFVDWLLRVIAWRSSAPPGAFGRNLGEAAAQAISSGTAAAGEIARPDLSVYGACPLRMRLFAEGIGFLPGAAADAAASVRSDLSAIAAYASRGNIGPGVSPHALYTVGPELLSDLSALAAERDVPLALHLAESPAEMEFLRSGEGDIARRLYPAIGKDVSFFRGIGTTLPSYLGAAGILRAGVLFVHNVHLSRAEIDALRDGGARFALCPRSNRAHGNGSPDVTHFVDAGIPFALGTDSLGSVPSLSLWEEMREARSLYRGNLPEEGLCRALFRAATANGSAALALPGGTLRAGGPADFAAVDDPGGHGVRAVCRLVDATGDGGVRLTAIAGAVLHGRA